MKRFSVKIATAFFILITMVVLFIGFFSGTMIRKQYLTTQENRLTEDAKLVTTVLDIPTHLEKGETALLSTKIKETNQNSQERMTIILTDGTVVADSMFDEATLENHKNRLEFKHILAGETTYVDTRKSDSSDEKMLYVSLPIKNSEQQLIGVIRLSMNIVKIEQEIHNIWLMLAVISFLTLIIAGIFSIIIAKRVAKPVEEVIDVAQDLSEKKYTSRYHGQAVGEVARLGDTMNHLAENLETQMQQISQNESQMKGLIDHLVIGVMQLDQNRSIQLINPAMEEIFAERAEALIGHQYAEASKSYGLTRMIEKAYRKNKSQNEEIYVYAPIERILDANVVPIPNKNSDGTDVIVLLYDITEIKRLEKIKSDFVANASHELKTPVTALKGFSETLLEGAKDDPDLLQQFLEIMYTESSRLDILIRDILQLSKLEQNQELITLEPFDLGQTITSIFKTMKPLANKKKIQMRLKAPANQLIMNSNKSRVQQILINLITNALAYSKKSGIVEVAIYLEQNEQVVIEVTDDGIGIPADELPRIFERFYRVDKARSRNSGGTGLGLSIVKYLVESFQGEIDVESQLGIGTTFRVKLPLN
ncbi:two-component system histidine kinase PnpS [Isobaculum melis]|uniref:histidine kinase n=1 Tax=Isobaculum melis TaxID=142588 RepID=A0A1H9QMD1_9LACT|nr:ATP-binding protein [Isobaculum melis]SER61598.1 histidine kinase [Isobaculum melis]